MLLKELFPFIKTDILITGITTDSRFVKPGFLFIPRDGNNYCGENFISLAIEKGAVAVVTKEAIPNVDIINITNENPIKILEYCLDKFYGKPYNDLTLIGVTGTDGKTTTSTFIMHLLSFIAKSGYIGTNGIYINNDIEENIFTTPLLSENYRLLRKFKDNDTKYVAMEVSSQGLINNRIKGLLFDYMVFTNLSHEHLDSHHNMDDYFNAKFELFKMGKPNSLIIVNKDDQRSHHFNCFKNVIYYSIYTDSDYQAMNISYHDGYIIFDLYTKDQIYEKIKINRGEEYNIYNVIPSIIIAIREGINIDVLYKVLFSLPIVPGRLEMINLDLPFKIFVDFAHTPKALSSVLSSLRRITKNKIIIVLGCAGKKDKSKRPLMGKIAVEYADEVIFTSEDPRNENPIDIINQMLLNVTTNNYHIIINRKKAIDFAISIAEKNDSIIVTGKGRENYFDVNGTIYKYSDYEYIKNSIKEKDQR